MAGTAAASSAASMMKPCEVYASAGVTFDVVVLAGGQSDDLGVLTDGIAKPLLPLCNQPLVWHALRPWVQRGCREFYLCVQHPFDAIKQALESNPNLAGVTFHFVNVPEVVDSQRTGSIHALDCYAKYKESVEKTGNEHVIRDFVVISCDTILENVDFAPFIANCYTEMASAGMLLTRVKPVAKPDPATSKKGKGSKGPEVINHKKELHYALLENPVVGELQASSLAQEGVSHRRCHYIVSEHDCPQDGLNLPVGKLARHLKLEASLDLTDPHVYFFRSWILDYVRHRLSEEKVVAAEDSEDEDMLEDEFTSIRRHLIPILTEKQYPVVNAAQKVTVDVSTRIHYNKPIPVHWSVAGSQGSQSVSAFNSVQAHQPQSWDVLRVFATVMDESPEMVALRINSMDNYRSVTKDMMTALTAAPSGSVKDESEFLAKLSPLAVVVRTQLLPHAHEDSNVRCAVPVDPTADPKKRIKIRGSAIAANVKLGDEVKIFNSVVMDGVEIGPRVTIRNSIVCGMVTVMEDAGLDNCVVASNNTIAAGEEHSDEVIGGLEFDDEQS